MYKAIHKQSNNEVKAWVNQEEGTNWFTIEFEGGQSINVHAFELEFIGDDRPEIGETTKTPIGLLPKEIHIIETDQKRFKDVSNAIYRYLTAQLKIDPKWVEEYNELIYLMNIKE